MRAVPAARALAQRLSIDLTQIRGTGRGQLSVGDDIAERALAGIVRRARQRVRDRSRAAVGERCGNFIVGFQ